MRLVPRSRAAAVLCTLAVLLGTSRTMASASAETQGKLVSFSFSPTSMDTSKHARLVDMVAHVTNSTAIRRVCVDIESPHRYQTKQGCSSVPASGSTLDGDYDLALPFPASSDQGAWRVAYVYLDDGAAGQSFDPAALGFPAVLNQTGKSHRATPGLPSFRVLTPTIATGGAATAARFTARITDPAATGQVCIDVRSVAPVQERQGCSYVPRSGTAQRGAWSVDVPLSAGSAPGTWHVLYVAWYERGYAVQYDDEPGLAARGYPTMFVVTR